MIMLFIIYAANLFKPKPPIGGVFCASLKAYYPGLYTCQLGAEPPLRHEIIVKIPLINETNT